MPAGVDRGSVREPANVVFAGGKNGKIRDACIKESVHQLPLYFNTAYIR
jgi:hypothetical protein